MSRFRHMLAALVSVLVAIASAQAAEQAGVTLQGKSGPGTGKSIVLVSGDEEYRSEETLLQLAKILAERQGFKCTVLFAIDKQDGTINPNQNDNIPGLEALDSADLLILFTRFRNLPDEQMKHLVNYIESGKPIIGLRTATHAFAPTKDRAFSRYGWQDKEWEGGFGRQVLGETWINHHGGHGSQSTRGIVAQDQAQHPILRGIQDGDIWGPTDVYGVRLPLPGDSQPLVLGQVLVGMKSDDKPLGGKKNDPMMPIAWTKTYETATGAKARVFTTTMGAAQDLSSEGLRRLLVNASFWCLGLEDRIKPDANVDIVGQYEPTPFGHNTYKKNVKPSDLSK